MIPISAAPCDSPAVKKRRLIRAPSSAASSATGGATPNQRSNVAAAWARNIAVPVTVRSPRARASIRNGVCSGTYTRSNATASAQCARRGSSERCGRPAIPTGVALTYMSDAGDVVEPACFRAESRATSARARRSRAATTMRSAPLRRAASATARAAPPAPRIATRAPRSATPWVRAPSRRRRRRCCPRPAFRLRRSARSPRRMRAPPPRPDRRARARALCAATSRCSRRTRARRASAERRREVVRRDVDRFVASAIPVAAAKRANSSGERLCATGCPITAARRTVVTQRRPRRRRSRETIPPCSRDRRARHRPTLRAPRP